MALYIDGRFAVTGKNSVLNLQNPINVTNEMLRLLSELNCCSNTQIIGGLPQQNAPSTPWPDIRVPRALGGKTLDSVEIQVAPSPDGDTVLDVNIAGVSNELVILQNQDKVILENIDMVVDEDDMVIIEVTSEATTPATDYVTYYKFV